MCFTVFRGQNDLAPRSPQSFEEDEGFSDWTQQLSRRKQKQMAQVDVEPHLNESHHSKVQLCSSSAQSKLYQNEVDMHDATTFKQTRSPLSNQKNVDEGDDEGDDVREKERMDNIHKVKEFRRWCEEEENTGRTKDNESWRRENQRCDMDEKVRCFRMLKQVIKLTRRPVQQIFVFSKCLNVI